MARNLVRFDPFREFDAITRDIFGPGVGRSLQAKVPAVDVYTADDDKSLVVEAHLPGFAEHDISVDVDKGALVIQAQRTEREEKDNDHKKKYIVRESSDSFYRSISLPEQADESAIAASFDHGVLSVTVPLAPEAAPKKIAISTGAA